MRIKKWFILGLTMMCLCSNIHSVNAAETLLHGEAAITAKTEEYDQAKSIYDAAVAEQDEKVNAAAKTMKEAENKLSNAGLSFMNEKIEEYQAKENTAGLTSNQWLSYLSTSSYVAQGNNLSGIFKNSFEDSFSYQYLTLIANMAIKQNECRKDTSNLKHGALSEQKLSYAKIMYSIISNSFNSYEKDIHGFTSSEFNGYGSNTVSQAVNAKIYCENWASSADVKNAFYMWYTEEKAYYDQYGSSGNNTGHYENICSDDPSVGFGCSVYGVTMNSGSLDGTEVTPETFLSDLNSYLTEQRKEYADASDAFWKICNEEQSKVNSAYEKLQTIENELAALKETGGHQWDQGTVSQAATCDKEGIITYTCSVCQDTKTEAIPKTSHVIATQKGYSATVFTAGLTDSQICEVCHTTISQASVIPKLVPTITLSKTSVTLKKKKSTTIQVSNLANGDSVKSWSSSNKKIAKVSSNGKIKGVKKGKATITVTLMSGKTAKIKVKVK